ncbi:hypothetical protein A1SE_01384, partial [Escherichia coli KTE53]
YNGELCADMFLISVLYWCNIYSLCSLVFIVLLFSVFVFFILCELLLLFYDL